LFHKGGSQVAPVKLKVVNQQVNAWDTKGQIRDTSSRWRIVRAVGFAWLQVKKWTMRCADARSLHFAVLHYLVEHHLFMT
jgi:hypothetical protein